MDIFLNMQGFPEIAAGKCAIEEKMHVMNFPQVKKNNLTLLMLTKFKPDHVKKTDKTFSPKHELSRLNFY